MVEIIWTEPALEDVGNIASYIALSNSTAAKSLVSLIFTKVERLSLFPDSGRKPPELSYFETAYLELVTPPCRLFYKQEQATIFILHVLRQERDVLRYIHEFEGEA